MLSLLRWAAQDLSETEDDAKAATCLPSAWLLAGWDYGACRISEGWQHV